MRHCTAFTPLWKCPVWVWPLPRRECLWGFLVVWMLSLVSYFWGKIQLGFVFVLLNCQCLLMSCILGWIRVYGIFLQQWHGWQLVWSRYWWLSVGFEYRSLTNWLHSMWDLVSKNTWLSFEISLVAFQPTNDLVGGSIVSLVFLASLHASLSSSCGMLVYKESTSSETSNVSSDMSLRDSLVR